MLYSKAPTSYYCIAAVYMSAWGCILQYAAEVQVLDY